MSKPEDAAIVFPEDVFQPPVFDGDEVELDDDSEDDVVYERSSTPEPVLVKSDENIKIPTDLQASEVIAAVESDDEDNNVSESESEDEDHYQKLENDINSSSLLKEKHPGITQSSYAEILTLTKVIRNDKGEVIDDLHRTYPFVTKYEKAKIIGVRTKQLNNGADPFVQVPSSMISGYKIAIEELKAQKIPFIIRRPIPNGGTEYWRLEDLELLGTY